MTQVRKSERPALWNLDASGKLSLNFHRGQLRAWDSQARFVFVLAGTQGGKTSFGPWWLWREIKKQSSGDYFIVAPNYDLLKLKLLPEVLSIFEHTLKIGRYWTKDKVIELLDPATGLFWAKKADDPMWGRIILRSASAEGGLESASAKGAWLDECGQDDFRVSAYEAIRRRLALSRGRILGTTTPYNLGWLKQRIFDPWLKGDDNYDVIQFESTMNPTFPVEEFEDSKNSMPEWRFNMFYRGVFDRPAGMIYGDFIHSLEADGGYKWICPETIPETWHTVVGVDPGGANTGTVILSKDPNTSRIYVLKAVLRKYLTSEEHIMKVQEDARKLGTTIKYWYVGNKGETQVRKDWGAILGVDNVKGPDFADVESGIDKVIKIIKKNLFRVNMSCIELLDEMGSYSRTTDYEGRVQEDIANKNNYHLLDALRYGIIGLDQFVPTWDTIIV